MANTARRWRAVTSALLFTALLPPAMAQTPRANYGPIPDDVWSYMQGRSWRAGLPCATREELVLMHVPYRDFDGATQTGELVVARRVATQVAAIFENIHASGKFRIYQMRLIDDFGGDDDISIAANNTSAFNCRTTDHGGLSKHALGLAIDINPVQNPYREGDVTAPTAGGVYDEPRERHPGVKEIILDGDVVTRAFARRGWSWGGKWTHTVDYQHFSYGGH
ncbi:MAG: M15 family metallopeptidase [Methylocystis sp.]|uniref:M15 family metallopeptidase n=1 Tax=Methylocystis sp. TaxID=1911079 RepID=UPI003DA3B3F6